MTTPATPDPPQVEVTALPVSRPVTAHDDLADRLVDAVAAAGTGLVDGDVVAVASKVVALVEGRTMPVAPSPATSPGDQRRALARRLARRVVADSPRALVVETHHGLVCANAGIDASNVPAGHVLALPEDPDASAARLRDVLADRLGAAVGVVVTDTFGRPWRRGQVDVAIGAAGIVVLRDERGGRDLQGSPLEVTLAAVADELAGAADLVRRKDSATPFVLVRGLRLGGDGAARELVRPPEEDLFPAGGPTLFAHAVSHGVGRRDPAGAVDAAVLARALRLVERPGVAFRVVPGDDRATSVVVSSREADVSGLLEAGGAIEALRIVLAGHDVPVTRVAGHALPGQGAADDPARPGWTPVAVLSVGAG